MKLLFTLLILLGSAVSQRAFQPTTTLQKETGNNTAAPDSISILTANHAPLGNVSKVPIRSLLYTSASTKVYAALMGWFGKGSHIAVGYDSRNAAQVRKQLEDMKSRGIDGAILAWYGKNSYENATALALKAQAEAMSGFDFALMIDQGTLQWDSMGLSPTDALIAHLNYMADTYYPSPVYMKAGGRPVVFEFALEMYTIDWARVRSSIRGNPLIIFRNPNGWTRPLSDGAYSWEPEKSDLSYLDYFYSQSKIYPLQQTVGSLSPSFNDSLATWTANRYADGQCGQLWLSKAATIAKYWSTVRQLPFVQIATWNDYEEGSTIESGIDNCLSVSAQAEGSTLRWSLSGNGNETTVNHYEVYASKNGTDLMHLGSLPAGAREVDVASYQIPAGAYSAYIKAVGKPSILNQMSNSASVVIASTGVPAAPSPQFSLQPAANSVTVTNAQPASVALQASAQSFKGTLSFSCSAPSWLQCSFAPQNLDVSSGSALTTLVIRAVQAASVDPVAATLLLLLIVGGLSLTRQRRVVAACGVMFIMLFTAACGGGAPQASTAPSSQTSASTSAKVFVIATPSDPSQAPKTIELSVTFLK